MSDYVKATDFASKDSLSSGDPDKIVSGAEIDAEFEAIEAAVATKANAANAALTGTSTYGGEEIGWRNLIWVATTGGTASPSEVRGKGYKTTGNIEVPASTFSADDIFAVYNNSASSVSITQGSGLTLRWAGTTNTGSRTLAARGLCFVSFISATEAVIVGAGLS